MKSIRGATLVVPVEAREVIGDAHYEDLITSDFERRYGSPPATKHWMYTGAFSYEDDETGETVTMPAHWTLIAEEVVEVDEQAP